MYPNVKPNKAIAKEKQLGRFTQRCLSAFLFTLQKLMSSVGPISQIKRMKSRLTIRLSELYAA